MNGFILIRCNVTFPNLNLREDVYIYDGQFNYLKFYSLRYTPYIENETVKLENTGSGTYYNITKTRKGFDALLLYDAIDEYIAVNSIVTYALDNDEDLIIVDYININPIYEDYAQGFTVRTGMIIPPLQIQQMTRRYELEEDVENPGSYIEVLKYKNPQGFNLKFREKTLSLY